MYNPTDVEIINGNIEIELILDVLNGCDNDCPGCFVNQKNKTTGEHIKSVLDFANLLTDSMDASIEIFLGSTDLFTAVNFEEIVTHQHFLDLPSHNVFTTTTLLSKPSIIRHRMKLLRNAMRIWGNNGELELFPVLDINRYINNDFLYISQLKEGLKICDPDVTVFIVNYYSPDMFDKVCLADLRDMIKLDFNAELRVIPSFFRSNKKETVLPRAFGYRDMVINQFCDKMDIVDRYVGPVPFTNFCFNKGEFYLNSYMYTDDQPQESELYHIPKENDGTYSFGTIIQKQQNIVSEQLEFANKTDECSSCKYLMNCVSRNVLTYMDDRNITQCMLPKELFDQLAKPEKSTSIRTGKHQISYIHS